MKKHRIPALLFALLAAAPLWAAELSPAVKGLQDHWAEIKYKTPAEQRVAKLEQLALEAHKVSQQEAGKAEPLAWEGIINATLAGEKGGLGALSLVEKARDLLLEAEKIDGKALNGSVYTSLGSLYYQVPGWPVGFGDDAKARDFLQKSLAINPDGIDPNYFFGDFLIDQGEYKEAVAYLEKALKAAPRPGREVADEGRRAEIKSALDKARSKL